MEQVIGVLGGGQLGRMLLQAASPLQLSIIVLDPEIASPAKQVSQPSLFSTPSLNHLDGAFTDEVKIRELATKVDVLTIEIEHVDCEALEKVAREFETSGGRSGKGVKVYPSPSVIKIIQDKYNQKIHLQKHSIAVAGFLPITSDRPSEDVEALSDSILAAGEKFGYPLMLKSRHLAYDGKGNFLLRSAGGVADALSALIPSASIKTGKPLQERLYAERFAPFVKEIAVMVVRGTNGQTRTYPAVETIHRESVCHIVYAPLRPVVASKNGIGRDQKGMGIVGGKEVGERARELARAAVDALGEGAVGVFGVEMFLMEDGELLLNEIAPRPHNSGHYTIEACSPSQYTSHLYAILSLPLPPIHFIPNSAGMLNLLGATSSLSDDFYGKEGVIAKAVELGASIHLYGKHSCRKGRKMGHITVMGESDEIVREKIGILVKTLPPMYQSHPPTALVAPNAPFSSPFPLVSIIMGSDSDLPIMLPATIILSHFKIPFELSIVSAHRTPSRMVEYARKVSERGLRVIIAGAGGAAHLPGMVASECSLPVIGVPVKASVLDGVDSLYSILQMPRGIPTATVGINNSTNAALLAVRILSNSIPRLTQQLIDYAETLEEEVMTKIAKLETVGWVDYGKK